MHSIDILHTIVSHRQHFDYVLIFFSNFLDIPVTMSKTANMRGSATTTWSSWKVPLALFCLEIAITQRTRLPADSCQIHYWLGTK